MNVAAETRPTLHEIAAMPLPASRDAMRRWYDPKWGTEIPLGDDGTPLRCWRVEADFSVCIEGDFDEEIEAESEEAARAKAREMIEDENYRGEVEIGCIKVVALDQ